MNIVENYSYRQKTMVLGVNRGYRAISRVFTNNYGYRDYCAIDMDDNYGFINNYYYWPETLVIANNYGYRTNIHCYWPIAIDIGFYVHVKQLQWQDDNLGY
jgi:hypothetical protein